MIPIDDPDDPRIEGFRAVRDRDVAGRHGAFVAEGAVVVRALLSARSRFRPQALLLARSRLPAAADLLAAAPPRLPVFVADGAVMDRIVGFPIHRGVLALGSRREGEPAAALLRNLPGPATVLVLIGLANHDNVGAAFRNAAAFGVDAVLLDGGSCDPLYRKAIRVSVGACLTVPFARGGTAGDLLADLARAGFETVALSPRGSGTMRDLSWPARVAIVAGAEGPGLPDSVLVRCRTIRIAMAPGFDSLNVATATAIALHEARAARLGASD